MTTSRAKNITRPATANNLDAVRPPMNTRHTSTKGARTIVMMTITTEAAAMITSTPSQGLTSYI